MGMFMRRKRRQIPGLNTASLPDLIFTMLFFFMIVTNMRESSPHAPLELPAGQGLEKVGETSGLHYIYIGMEQGKTYVQWDDDVLPLGQLEHRFRLSQQSVETDGPLEIALGVDGRVEMQQVEEVKQVLRRNRVSVVYYLGEESRPEH